MKIKKIELYIFLLLSIYIFASSFGYTQRGADEIATMFMFAGSILYGFTKKNRGGVFFSFSLIIITSILPFLIADEVVVADRLSSWIVVTLICGLVSETIGISRFRIKYRK